MRFNCGPTYRERIDAKEKWHLWFAWHPIRLGSRDCRWLETMWRKGEFWCNIGGSGWTWEYMEYGLSLIFPESE